MELPSVLWSIRTTPNRSTIYTPFFLVYGAEAILPSDIRHDSPRVVEYVEADNEKARQDALDILDEERELVAAKSAIYQQDLRRYHSRRIKTRTFQEGDLVLRLIQEKDGMHKLSSPWEGPFVVRKNLYNGSYYLVDMREKEKTDTSQMYLLFQTLLLLFWLHSCMIWTKLTRTDAVFSKAASAVLLCAGFWIFRYTRKIPKNQIKISVTEGFWRPEEGHRAARGHPGACVARLPPGRATKPTG